MKKIDPIIVIFSAFLFIIAGTFVLSPIGSPPLHYNTSFVYDCDSYPSCQVTQEIIEPVSLRDENPLMNTGLGLLLVLFGVYLMFKSYFDLMAESY